jgi:PAS domain S-box
MTLSQPILIVDDDVNLRKTLTDILHLKGYEALGAKNGRDAISTVESRSIPVALIDLRLVDMPGLEVLKKVKDISPKTECIILTGFASTESAIQAINLGAYSYLQKPYDVDQLIVTIQRALEIKETAQSLSESEQRYRQIYEGAIDGIIVLDLVGKIIDFNSSLLNMLQYSDDDLKKLTIWDITPQKWHEDTKRIHEQVISRGYSDLLEKEYIRKDGATIPVEISGFVTRDAQNEAVGMWAFVRDISGRKKSEEAMRRQLLEVTALHGIASAGNRCSQHR